MTSYLSGCNWSEFTASEKPGAHDILLRVFAGAQTRAHHVLFAGI